MVELIPVVVALIVLGGNVYLGQVNKSKEIELSSQKLMLEASMALVSEMRAVWEDKGALLKDTLYVAGNLTFESDIESESFLKSYERMWMLIYGELPMYNVESVRKVLIRFADLAYIKKRLDPENDEGIKEYKKKMKPLLIELGTAIKENSVTSEFGDHFKTLIKKGMDNG